MRGLVICWKIGWAASAGHGGLGRRAGGHDNGFNLFFGDIDCLSLFFLLGAKDGCSLFLLLLLCYGDGIGSCCKGDGLLLLLLYSISV